MAATPSRQVISSLPRTCVRYSDRQLPDAGPRLGEPRRELDLETEAVGLQRQALEQVGAHEFVARLHVGQVRLVNMLDKRVRKRLPIACQKNSTRRGPP